MRYIGMSHTMAPTRTKSPTWPIPIVQPPLQSQVPASCAPQAALVQQLQLSTNTQQLLLNGLQTQNTQLQNQIPGLNAQVQQLQWEASQAGLGRVGVGDNVACASVQQQVSQLLALTKTLTTQISLEQTINDGLSAQVKQLTAQINQLKQLLTTSSNPVAPPVEAGWR
jgi:peptidoglycan hydrolase CwlO-like protein